MTPQPRPENLHNLSLLDPQPEPVRQHDMLRSDDQRLLLHRLALQTSHTSQRVATDTRPRLDVAPAAVTRSTPDIPRRPPEGGELALDVVDEQGAEQHEQGAEQDEGDEEPAEGGDGRVDGGHERGRAAGRVHGVGDAHDDRRRAAADGPGDPAQRLEVGAQLEELGDGDADDGGEGVPDDRAAWLCEGRLDRVVVEDGGCALR